MPNTQHAPLTSSADYRELRTHLDRASRIVWLYMQAQPRPCYTPRLLAEIKHYIEYELPTAPDEFPEFLVSASSVPGLFNLGGDLALFKDKIENRDLDGLRAYGRLCVDAIYFNHAHPTHPGMTTIALVQGDALGGGFEAAISANIIVAERGAKMGFPEIMFNLFPGMGAMTFLGRKIGFNSAEKMILGGKLFLAEELYDLGVVDVLAETGEGQSAVLAYIKRARRALNGTLAARAARNIAQPVARAELDQIVDAWAEAALRVTPKDLAMMMRLVNRQNGKFGQ